MRKNAFDVNYASTLGKELERNSQQRRSSTKVVEKKRAAGTEMAVSVGLSKRPTTIDLEPRRFHVYARAGVSGIKKEKQ